MKRDRAPRRRRWSGCVLPSGETGSITVEDGVVAAIEPRPAARDEAALDLEGGGTELVDVTGFAVLARLADAHVHLDKTLLGGPWRGHRGGPSLEERLADERDALEGGSLATIAERAGALLGLLVSNGATAARSHVDVSGRLGLSRVEPLLALATTWADRIDVELVAFPQEGVVRARGTAAALGAALRAGCGVVGGLDPEAFDGDRLAQLELVVGLAVSHGAGLDVHVHERGEEGAKTLELLARLVSDAGLGGRAAVSHGFAFADLFAHDRPGFDRLAEHFASSGVSLVTSLPGEGLCPPLGALRSRGVRVVVASDNIRDAWSPFGRADPLERACLAAYLEGWRTDEALAGALALVSGEALGLLGRSGAGLEPGAPADLTFVRASGVGEAVVAQPAERIVVRNGEVVHRSPRVDVGEAPGAAR